MMQQTLECLDQHPLVDEDVPMSSCPWGKSSIHDKCILHLLNFSLMFSMALNLQTCSLSASVSSVETKIFLILVLFLSQLYGEEDLIPEVECMYSYVKWFLVAGCRTLPQTCGEDSDLFCAFQMYVSSLLCKFFRTGWQLSIAAAHRFADCWKTSNTSYHITEVSLNNIVVIGRMLLF